MRFKALVADDESMIRHGIISFLNRYGDFEVAAEAEDGETALELAQKISVDVYFVDINMPFLSGLEFIKALKKIQPEALVVIISGYDSFAYAKDALRMNVFEYLLKPVMEDDFDEMIVRLRKRLNAERSEGKYLKWAKDILNQNRKYLASAFLQKALEGHFTEEEMRERFDYLNVEIPEDYILTIVHLDYIKAADTKEEWTDDLIFFVAENAANEIFNQMYNLRSCQSEQGDLLLLSPQTEKQQEQLGQFLAWMRRLIFVNCVVTQKTGSGLKYLPDVYQEAAAEAEELLGNSSVIRNVRDYMEQNYWREDFSLQEAADYANLSTQYMSKLFRREMEVTFVDYLTSVRIRKSIDLFADKELKIYEIAGRVGYASQRYFSTVFKKHLGVSPVEYRRRMEEKQS